MVCCVLRSATLKYGMWDQVRVDHGTEFYLSLYMQEKNADMRTNVNRQPYIQTESKRVSFTNTGLLVIRVWSSALTNERTNERFIHNKCSKCSFVVTCIFESACAAYHLPAIMIECTITMPDHQWRNCWLQHNNTEPRWPCAIPGANYATADRPNLAKKFLFENS